VYTENVPHSGDIIQVRCTDSGGIPLRNATYDIIGGSVSERFTIDPTSGQISWNGNQTLDYEATPFLLFDIMCMDNYNSSNPATAQVNVSVGPVNEFPPEISPGIVSVSIAEDAPQGTILVSTQPGGQRQYTVTDRDDGPDGIDGITYTLSNTIGAPLDGVFTINQENGALVLARELDVDNIPNVLDFRLLTITACDTDTPRDECPNLSVTIIVQSAADNDPMFSENQYTVALPESTPGGSIIATSMCSDQDNGVGRYGGIDIVTVIPTSPDDLFQVDSPPAEGKNGSADLILQGQLDYETTRIYNITLRCYDNQRTPRQDLAQVVIKVLPVNDEPPVFENSFYSFAVNRISTSGVDIGQIVAVDRDQQVGGELSYSILSGDTDNFGVRLDGMVYLKDRVYAFEGKSFDLVVIASDGVFNSTTAVRITMSGFLSIPEIGIVVAAAVLLVAIVVLVLCFYKLWRSSRSDIQCQAPPHLPHVTWWGKHRAFN
jgi:hypothetical protein